MTRGTRHGDVVWYEYLTADVDAAQAFYAPLIGWQFVAMPQGDVDYRIALADGAMIAGFEHKDGVVPGRWAGFVAVDDVDAAVARAVAAGGRVDKPVFDVPGIGRMAIVANGEGVPLHIAERTGAAESASFARTEPRVGAGAWNELAVADPDQAKAWLAMLFGWEPDGAMPMGDLGSYDFLRAGDHMVGAVMPMPPMMTAPAWTFYFRVPDIDAAAAQVPATGGHVIQEPIEIPGGDFSMVALDPAGGLFGLVGARRK